MPIQDLSAPRSPEADGRASSAQVLTTHGGAPGSSNSQDPSDTFDSFWVWVNETLQFFESACLVPCYPMPIRDRTLADMHEKLRLSDIPAILVPIVAFDPTTFVARLPSGQNRTRDGRQCYQLVMLLLRYIR